MAEKIMLVVMLLLATVAYHYHGEYQNARQRADKASAALKTATRTLNELEARQHELAALDTKHTQELADAKAQNDDLRRRLSAGGRVRVEGRCPSVPGRSAAGSVGDAATVELSSVAGQNVLSIREGIISDRHKINYLQDYIRHHCTPLTP